MLLSSVPILRRKKGTEKLAPVTCAHAAAEEGTEKLAPVICAHAAAEEGYKRAFAA